MVVTTLGGGILGAAVLGGGAALLAGGAQSKAAEKAGSLQARTGREAALLQLQATQEAIAEQRRQFNLSRFDLAPYRETGVPALAQYAALSGIRRVRQAPALAEIERGKLSPAGELLSLLSRGGGLDGRSGGGRISGMSANGGGNGNGGEMSPESGPAGPEGRFLHNLLSFGMPAPMNLVGLLGRAIHKATGAGASITAEDAAAAEAIMGNVVGGPVDSIGGLGDEVDFGDGGFGGPTGFEETSTGETIAEAGGAVPGDGGFAAPAPTGREGLVGELGGSSVGVPSRMTLVNLGNYYQDPVTGNNYSLRRGSQLIDSGSAVGGGGFSGPTGFEETPWGETIAEAGGAEPGFDDDDGFSGGYDAGWT